MRLILPMAMLLVVAGCASSRQQSLQACAQATPLAPEYIIGAGDSIDVFVWRNADLSATVPVRPDGRVSIPLVEDMIAVGKTPTVLARDIEAVLAEFIRDPTVNIIVRTTGGGSQIQVVGSVESPRGVPYREGITVLDAVVGAGGLTQFASGNRATIVRTVGDRPLECRVRLDDLIQDGDVSQNIRLQPGDFVIVPEANF